MKVTITGADDKVDPLDLFGLSTEFPYVEWGILFSVKRMGTPRYPSAEWLHKLGKMASPNMQLSLHLCGQAAHDTVDGDPRWLQARTPFKRIQLNTYEPGSIHKSNGMAILASIGEVIFQARDRAALLACAEDARIVGVAHASVLYDPSGGRGISTQGWPEPPTDVRVGYAGGIGPDNVEATLETVMPLGAAWIDMESGVREDDEFDLVAVRHVLERSARVINDRFAAQWS